MQLRPKRPLPALSSHEQVGAHLPALTPRVPELGSSTGCGLKSSLPPPMPTHAEASPRGLAIASSGHPPLCPAISSVLGLPPRALGVVKPDGTGHAAGSWEIHSLVSDLGRGRRGGFGLLLCGQMLFPTCLTGKCRLLPLGLWERLGPQESDLPHMVLRKLATRVPAANLCSPFQGSCVGKPRPPRPVTRSPAS